MPQPVPRESGKAVFPFFFSGDSVFNNHIVIVTERDDGVSVHQLFVRRREGNLAGRVGLLDSAVNCEHEIWEKKHLLSSSRMKNGGKYGIMLYNHNGGRAIFPGRKKKEHICRRHER